MSHLGTVLVWIAVKRHHDQGNSYEGKHFTGAGLQFQRFSPLSSWWEAWRCAGRHGAEMRVLHLDLKAVRRLTSTGNQKEALFCTGWCLSTRRPQSPPTQWCTSSNKATPISIRPHLLIVPLPMGHSYSNHHITLRGTQRLFQTYESMEVIPSHSIMQNTFSPTSKVPIVYHNLNNVCLFIC